MGNVFTPKGTVYRNDSVDVKLSVMDTATGAFVRRADVVRIECRLVRDHPNPTIVANWSINVESSITDGPVFHQQDPSWPFHDAGYNFTWMLPRGYLESAPAKYRLIFEIHKIGLAKSTHNVLVEVLSP